MAQTWLKHCLRIGFALNYQDYVWIKHCIIRIMFMEDYVKIKYIIRID